MLYLQSIYVVYTIYISHVHIILLLWVNPNFAWIGGESTPADYSYICVLLLASDATRLYSEIQGDVSPDHVSQLTFHDQWFIPHAHAFTPTKS